MIEFRDSMVNGCTAIEVSGYKAASGAAMMDALVAKVQAMVPAAKVEWGHNLSDTYLTVTLPDGYMFIINVDWRLYDDCRTCRRVCELALVADVFDTAHKLSLAELQDMLTYALEHGGRTSVIEALALKIGDDYPRTHDKDWYYSPAFYDWLTNNQRRYSWLWREILAELKTKLPGKYAEHLYLRGLDRIGALEVDDLTITLNTMGGKLHFFARDTDHIIGIEHLAAAIKDYIDTGHYTPDPLLTRPE